MNSRTTLTKSVLAFIGVASMSGMLLVGCGQYSRYNPNDKYGDQTKSDTKTWNANLAAPSSTDADKEQTRVVKVGREIFNDAKVGNNGQSCNSCHPGGGTTGGEVTVAKKMGLGPYTMPIPPLIGAAARFPKYKVPNAAVISMQQMANNCIRMFMDGKRMPENSPESIALLAYLNSLSDGEDISVGNGSSR